MRDRHKRGKVGYFLEKGEMGSFWGGWMFVWSVWLANIANFRNVTKHQKKGETGSSSPLLEKGRNEVILGEGMFGRGECWVWPPNIKKG